MIIEWFLTVFANIAEWFIGLFPTWTVPPEIAGFDATVNGFLSSFSGLGVWVPWTLVITCVGISVTVWLIGLGIKAARWLIGLIPTMGGGT